MKPAPPDAILPTALRDILTVQFGAVSAARRVPGGDTSSAARINTSAGRLFVKWGRGHAALSYDPEADGLRALASVAPEGIVVPEVLASAPETVDVPGYLVLPWLEPGYPSGASWASFGESLAELHASTIHGNTGGRDYGWPHDNYLGLAPQPNDRRDDWPSFYASQRLEAMRRHATDIRRWDRRWDGLLDVLLADLPSRLPAKPHAALVHGDLWSGNAHALADGRFALIDPAVYVGHAEVDLAAAQLFGGFAAGFYEGYRSGKSAAAGEAERREIYQLYHWMMHLAVSAGYGAQVEASLGRLT